MTAIAPDVLEVLAEAAVDDGGLRLVGQLDPKLYARCKKVLLGLGWKWHSGRQVHLATSDSAREKLAAAVGGGAYVDPAKDEGFFATPARVAEYIACAAGIGDLPAGARVLEPSAGDGALLRAIHDVCNNVQVVAVEPNADRCRAAAKAVGKGTHVLPTSFEVGTFEAYAATAPDLFDGVLMNPPFALPGQPTAWADHLELAWSLLAPGGRLGCIAPVSFEFRDDKRHRALRQWVKDLDGEWEPLPEDAFRESGTGVRTLLIILRKPASAETPAPPPEGANVANIIRPIVTPGLPPAKTSIVTVRVDRIDRRPDQPREHFDEVALAELAESIRLRGLLQPPVVRRKADGRYELVAGERRHRAVLRLGWSTLQVKLSGQDDDVEAFIDAMTENVVREDMTPMEEARGYGRLRDEGGRTVQEIAALFGKRPEQVAWRLRLLDLIPDAAAAVDAGTVRPYFAGELAALAPANQTRLLARYARGEFGSETEAIAMVRAVAASEQQEVIFGSVDDDTDEARAVREQRVRQVDTWFGQLSRLTQVLDDIAAADPEALHTGLAGMVSARIDQLGAVARSVRKAQGTLQRARALGALDGEAATA